MAKKEKTFVIFDGNALIHRSFHALPPLTIKDGRMVNAVYGFTAVLLKVVKELKPEYWAVAFDVSGPTFRHKMYKEYKATRQKAPQELYDQIPMVKQVVESFHIPVLEKAGYEADDVIGTAVHQVKNVRSIIVTGDGDSLQLVSPQTQVYKIQKGITDTKLFGVADVKEKYGLTPEQIIDYKALRGDPSDNIPGVRGIGEKTATQLLQDFDTLEKIYAALDAGGKKAEKISERIQKLLHEHKKEAELSKKLATIDIAMPLELQLEDCAVQHYDRSEVAKLFQEFEFKSLLNRLPDIATSEKSSLEPTSTQASLQFTTEASPKKKVKDNGATYQCITTEAGLKKVLEEIEKAPELAVDTETTGVDPFRDRLIGISLSWKPGLAAYVPVDAHPDLVKTATFNKLKGLLVDTNLPKIGHNIKFDLEVLCQAGLSIAPLSFDSMIAAYLINSGTRRYGLDDLVFTELGYEMQPIEELIGPKGKKQKTMDQVPVEEVSWYACEDADYTLRLAQHLRAKLKEQNILGLFSKIDMPLVGVLAEMEQSGIKIDAEFLEKMGKQVGKDIGKLEKKIHEVAGSEFNIQSPLQLKKVLFEQLELDTRGIGKTKTGLSTAASELEKLKDLHPIIPLILEFRELAKLKNTYLDALPELVNPKTGRVHTDFNQTIAATGRLSSVNPNLQNIPIRTELGNEIRKAFVTERGYRLISVDYSQIELRVIASIANDPKMIATFQRGEDIHTMTASAIHDVPPEKVSKELRRTAKEVNFGVIYGLGYVGLAQRQGISRDEARAFIEKYFFTYTKVKEWIEQTKLLAAEQGYVETLYGRRRYLPEIVSSNHMIRAQAERIAVNMPIQGTAADLMKLAMLKVAEELPKEFPKARMLLQVHDELVFEAPADEAEAVARLVKKLMEEVAELRVPVLAEAEIGLNWGEMKALE
ncbi:MAG: DNA polymerase I [Candidatus Nomurabacteria bacterium]|nr:MAG: DNA polymerase I [Candidatus Nomurabacteria bacterium]